MEIGHLSFYMSFLDHLHHSIIWQVGFDSGPGLMCYGIGRIPLWAELFYWVHAPTPFIRRRFRPMSWACVLGHVFLSAPSIAPSPWLKQAQARDEAFLELVAASTWLTGDGLI